MEGSSKSRLPHRKPRYAYHDAELITKVAPGNRSLFPSTTSCHVELNDTPGLKLKTFVSVPGTLVEDGIAPRLYNTYVLMYGTDRGF